MFVSESWRKEKQITTTTKTILFLKQMMSALNFFNEML